MKVLFDFDSVLALLQHRDKNQEKETLFFTVAPKICARNKELELKRAPNNFQYLWTIKAVINNLFRDCGGKKTMNRVWKGRDLLSYSIMISKSLHF